MSVCRTFCFMKTIRRTKALSEHGGQTIDSYVGKNSNSKKTKEARIVYGTHEMEVSEGGEANLHKHFLGCKKNPGHEEFLPVDAFNINHLPEGYHDNDILELVKATADLTMRVAVKWTSTKRPEFWPNSKVPYPCFDIRGRETMRLGTGLVWKVIQFDEKDNMGTCQCHFCQSSDAPSKVWGVVGVYTAAHVVFDDFELEHTTFRLFFDGENSPLVTLEGWTVLETNVVEDNCVLECVSCNIGLLDKLYNRATYWNDLWCKITNKYKKTGAQDKLLFIVSHPHGCPKHISVGHWIKRDCKEDHKTQYEYTTSTCPGCSGAYIYPLAFDRWVYYGHHVHTGVNDEGRNYSSYGLNLFSFM